MLGLPRTCPHTPLHSGPVAEAGCNPRERAGRTRRSRPAATGPAGRRGRRTLAHMTPRGAGSGAGAPGAGAAPPRSWQTGRGGPLRRTSAQSASSTSARPPRRRDPSSHGNTSERGNLQSMSPFDSFRSGIYSATRRSDALAERRT